MALTFRSTWQFPPGGIFKNTFQSEPSLEMYTKAAEQQLLTGKPYTGMRN